MAASCSALLSGRTPRGVRGLKFKQCLELRQVLKSHTPQGVRGLKYLLCLRVNINRESHPALWKSQEKSNEKSNDKVPDKVQVSMREPVEETRDLIALYAESSQAQHMCLALLENIISVLQSTCKNRA